MKVLVLIVALAMPALGQLEEIGTAPSNLAVTDSPWVSMGSAVLNPRLSVSFARQTDAQTKDVFGATLKDTILVHTTICNNTDKPVVVHAGHVSQAAARKKITTIAPMAVPYMLKNIKRRNWLRITMEVLQYAATAAALGAGSGIFEVGNELAAGLLVGAQGADEMADRLRKEIPNEAVLAERFLKDMMQVPGQACAERWMFVSKMDNEIVTADIP